MIEVKGTKPQEAESDPAQRYVFKNADKRSRTPAILAALLTGLALYLKSIFPGSTVDAEKPAGTEEEDEPLAEPEPLILQASLPELLDGISTGSVDPLALETSGRMPFELPPPTVFPPIDIPDLGIIFEPDLDWEFPSPGTSNPVRPPANDNSSGGHTPKPTVPDGEEDPDDGDDTDDDDTDPDDDDDEAPDDDNDCPAACEGDGDPCEEDPETANRAPRITGPVYLMDVSACAILAIGLSDLLENATDPDGDALAVRNITVSSGTITQTEEGWDYESGASQMFGPVTISYEITDGEFSVVQTAHFSVVRSHIEGSSGDDTLLGTMCADEIDGGCGDDNIDARAGSDVIDGGYGDDHIVAGAGDDTVFGGHGDDIIFGGLGDDHISGGAGHDRLFGEEGNDIVFGDDGDDHLSGGEGEDILSGGAGNDVLAGDAGSDSLSGGEGDDILEGGVADDVIDAGEGTDIVYGGSGDDTIVDGTGEDTVYAGSGNDLMIASLDGDADLYDGEEGLDAIDYSETAEGVAVDLSAGTAVGAETGADSIEAIETVYGGGGDDTLTGSESDDTLVGSEGGDLIDGSSGADVLLDGGGEDTVFGGAGDDHVVAAADGDNDFFDGEEGCDTLDYSGTAEGVTVDLENGAACGVEIGEDTISGFENVIGGSGDDHIIVGDAPAVLVGGEGENTFEFPPPPPSETSTSSTYEIFDFKVGDLIRMSKYDLFEEVLDELDDRFEEIYGDDIDDDDIPIRYRHDWSDDEKRTVIEADFNDDNTYEMSISLHGHHMLVIIENV